MGTTTRYPAEGTTGILRGIEAWVHGVDCCGSDRGDGESVCEC